MATIKGELNPFRPLLFRIVVEFSTNMPGNAFLNIAESRKTFCPNPIMVFPMNY